MSSSTINNTDLDNLTLLRIDNSNMSKNTVDNLRNAQGKNACGNLQYQLGCVCALHLESELAQQFGFVARLEGAASLCRASKARSHQTLHAATAAKPVRLSGRVTPRPFASAFHCSVMTPSRSLAPTRRQRKQTTT